MDPTPGDEEQHWQLLLPLSLQWFDKTHSWLQNKALRCLAFTHIPQYRGHSSAAVQGQVPGWSNAIGHSLTKASSEGENYTPALHGWAGGQSFTQRNPLHSKAQASSPSSSWDPSAVTSHFPLPGATGQSSPEFSLSAGQPMTCSVLPLVQYSAQCLVKVEGHVILCCLENNHRIIKVGKNLQDHQIQPSTDYLKPIKPHCQMSRLLIF